MLICGQLFWLDDNDSLQNNDLVLTQAHDVSVIAVSGLIGCSYTLIIQDQSYLKITCSVKCLF